jgi:hypothetical protein
MWKKGNRSKEEKEEKEEGREQTSCQSLVRLLLFYNHTRWNRLDANK